MDPRTLRAVGFALMIGFAAGCDGGAETKLPEVENPGAEVGPAAATGAGAEIEPAGMATLRVDSLDGAPYLTDGQGRALYLLEGEPADSVTCRDACTEEWPPYLAPQGSPRAGAAAVRQDLIGTVRRPNGQTQVTYGGHPLYYYHEDTGPGEATGQDVTDRWGEWYLVQPNGQALEQHGGGSHE